MARIAAYSAIHGPVRAHRAMDRVDALAARESPAAAGEDETARKPLQVPFERALERLVEVVHVEGPLRRREEPEVREMSVTAQLDVDPARRRRARSAARRCTR